MLGGACSVKQVRLCVYARLKRVASPVVEGQRVSLLRMKARKHQRGE